MSNAQNLDEQIFQLKQTIMFLKSEITRYQHELQHNDYYSLNLNLENENAELKQQGKLLSLELLKLQRNFDKEQENFKNEIQKLKEQKQKNITSIQKFIKEKESLRNDNAQLTKEKNRLLDENAQLTKEKDLLLDENTQLTKENNHLLNENAQLAKEKDLLLDENTQLTIEKNHLFDENAQLAKEKDHLLNEKAQLLKTIQQTKNEMKTLNEPTALSANKYDETIISDFSHKIEQQIQQLHDEFKLSQSNYNMHIIGKIEKESTDVKKLLHTLKQSKPLSPTINHQDGTLLSSLDNQINLIYSKALEFEKKLEEKIQLLHNMEQQLDELISDIEKQ